MVTVSGQMLVIFFQKLTDNCDPVYDETFEYKGPLSESQLRTLEVLVVSKKTFAKNPVIGMVSLPLLKRTLN